MKPKRAAASSLDLAFLVGMVATLILVALMMAAPTEGAGPLPGDEERKVLDGKAIFLDQKCNLCHTVSSAGIEATTKSEKMKGPDLTVAMTEKKRDAEWLNKLLRKQIELEGKKHAKEFKGSDEELGALIAWLQKQKKNP